MADDGATRAWIMLAAGDDRQHGGNQGYEDKPDEYYRWDESVPNHRAVEAGDVVILHDKQTMLGAARIDRIRTERVNKRRERCPKCSYTGFKKRARSAPTYRCPRCTTEFDDPVLEFEEMDGWVAEYGGSFVPSSVLTTRELRDAPLKPNDNLSIQRVDLGQLMVKLRTVPGFVDRVLHPAPPLDPQDAQQDVAGEYVPTGVDSRKAIERQIRARRGQPQFRKALLARYADACAITGCTLVDILEAAHIQPARDDNDNHPSNGLLLRTDLHTLFDLHLLAIDPQRLTIHVHPRVRAAGYDHLEGASLRIAGGKPSEAALTDRWARFRASLANPPT
jgi:putative restriction endonuclease